MTSPTTPPAQEIQALFDRIAPSYDQLNDGLSLGLHRIWKQMAVRWSGAAIGDTCVDICCGSGDVARLLAHRVGAQGQVYGVDFAAAQLAIAQSHPHQAIRPVTWIEADALHLPFDDQTFDAATLSYGLRNLVDIPGSLREIHRVLKPTAKVAILDFHRPQSPLFRTFQQWYLDHWVVPTAQRLGLREEYAYISASLDRFPIGSEQVKLALDAGFSTATHYPITGGMMGVLVATKGDATPDATPQNPH
ncbi:MAG: bifunctional demethylmenaquinone methyltransferase/2-methoxy-6-polyprenyl-1,4-benzoquinol methylase UbiE [Oculatellaceae cyanobacterium Prado106]|nr:bifunctional demethylmenaquinone methyltransferase/2-methoxy-6-polyprenyl-1,4-benzoquinol methylase UbiE [Oculatellaceae cyanobacterium Prado106]